MLEVLFLSSWGIKQKSNHSDGSRTCSLKRTGLLPLSKGENRLHWAHTTEKQIPYRPVPAQACPVCPDACDQATPPPRLPPASHSGQNLDLHLLLPFSIPAPPSKSHVRCTAVEESPVSPAPSLGPGRLAPAVPG